MASLRNLIPAITQLLPFSGPKTVKPGQTRGTSGTVVSGGYVIENEKSAELTGQQKYTTFAEVLLNNSIVASGVRYFLNLVAKPNWRAEAADDSDEAKRAAELVDMVVDGLATPWSRVIRRQAMYRFYGFTVQEWTASRRKDGKVGMLDIESRPQHTITRWDVDRTGTVVGVIQTSPDNFEELYLPREKIIYSVDDSLNDSPAGVGLLRHVVPAVRRLDEYLWLEGVGFTTDLRGIPVGRAPLAELDSMVAGGDLTVEDRTALLQPIEDFVRSHMKGPRTGMMLDSATYRGEDEAGTPSNVKAWDVQLLQGTPTSAPDLGKAIHRLNVEIARVLGVEHMLIGNDGKGSLALSKDKTNNFYLTVDSTLHEIAEVLRRDWVARICELNGIREEVRPKLKPDAIRFRDIEEVTRSLRAMAQAGIKILSNDPAVGEVYDLIGLSRPPEDDRDEEPEPNDGLPDDGQTDDNRKAVRPPLSRRREGVPPMGNGDSP